MEDLIELRGRPKLKLSDKYSHAIASPAAIERGRLRWTQGYLFFRHAVHESRMLQMTIFGTFPCI